MALVFDAMAEPYCATDRMTNPFSFGSETIVPALTSKSGTWMRKLARVFYGRKILGLVAVGSRQVTSVRLRLPVAPERMELYRSLLPREFDLPAVPRVYFYISEFQGTYPAKIKGGYREAAVCIRASYKGDSRTDPARGGWHVLTMPVSAASALKGGLMTGYPKYLADIALEVRTDDAVGTVRTEGLDVFQMSWRSAETSVPDLDEEGVTVPVYLLADGRVNIMQNEVPEQNSFECRTGVTTVGISAPAQWTGLLDSLEVKAPGVIKMFTGRFNLTRRSR